MQPEQKLWLAAYRFFHFEESWIHRNMLHLRIPRERRAPLLRGHGLRMKQIRTMSRGWTKEVLSPGQQREQAEPLGRTVGMN